MTKGQSVKQLVRGALASTAVVAAVALAGCGSADVAATVDGRTITESDAQVAAEQINRAFKPETPVTPRTAVTLLIRAPYIIDYAAAHGHPQTESVARQALKDVPDPAQPTIDIMRAESALSVLGEADKVALSQQLHEIKPTVNPRYGTYDPAQASLRTDTPNWLTPAASEQ